LDRTESFLDTPPVKNRLTERLLRATIGCMSINGLTFLEVRRPPGKMGFMVHATTQRGQPRTNDYFESEEALLTFLRGQKLTEFTPEQALYQAKATGKFILTAEDTCGFEVLNGTEICSVHRVPIQKTTRLMAEPDDHTEMEESFYCPGAKKEFTVRFGTGKP
jgi:hypothetical protein